ncbi:outer membrane lipoprotein carrier protein LolA [Bradyrhizobium sp. U87765 SZCCT0131]|nr:outer membrane lipoprotein carrier protein LolA [Bradyrhizobium sp. U87765 SZCCT0131]MBR1259409.1 outer membrane lipoprotein carrier protein LolA [Bradyrhizobium sp. U87765 SZCCT0134]MBR1305550.1 outer membrane lipoprotein carrier protein LolA [Bradyrhizobium sp. U87765 SZCCT0110]MBR1321917.1 outer membrane lipoprotein carrier protein LolA [Bradyrhizobium sp. U87765 SZCCT0109]MBR1350805.1 outer membrane lipoprotein carrier protein LolA [Bradyrhizobium sp. U87765 SZCCT0048]
MIADRPSASSAPARGTRLRCAATGVTIALLAAVLVPAAMAQAIPLPKPAPKTRDGGVASTVRSVTPAAPAAAAAATPPDPVIPDPRNRAVSSIFTTFDANQRAQAAKISSYLSSLQNLSGNFVQVGPDGTRSTGTFYIQKPGKVRFEYDPPSKIAIIADGSSVVVRDTKLATQDLYPLSQTPLRFLLSDRIDLMKDTNVVGVSADDMFVSVTIEEKQPLVGTSRLMLMLGAKDNQLKQWTITDPQGYDTTIAIYNIDSIRKIDPGIFKIDYAIDQYRNPQ